MKSAEEINAALNAVADEARKNGFAFVAGIQYDTHHEIFGTGEVSRCIGLIQIQDITLKGRYMKQT